MLINRNLINLASRKMADFAKRKIFLSLCDAFWVGLGRAFWERRATLAAYWTIADGLADFAAMNGPPTTIVRRLGNEHARDLQKFAGVEIRRIPGRMAMVNGTKAAS